VPRDYYDVLDVDRDASQDELKSAYRKHAMKYHPDRNPDDPDAEKKFKEAAEAYEVLSDEEQRRRYDRFGHAGVQNGAGGGGRGRGRPGAGFQDISDIFEQFNDIFGGRARGGGAGGGAAGGGAGGTIFEEVFGGGGGRRQRRRGRGGGRQGGAAGGDLRIRLKLTLEEISEGVEKDVKVRRYVPCETCEGTGSEEGADGFVMCDQCNGNGEVREVSRSVFGQMVNVRTCPKCGGEGRKIKSKCPDCGGEGRKKTEETITIPVPAGAMEGHHLTMREEGNAGKRGGPAGDLQVEIIEKQHEHFTREELDVYYNLYISFPEAALGTEAEVPTLKGRARLEIDAGTQAGKILRMKERGLPELRSNRRGDQLVRVHVWTPRDLTSEQRRQLEEWNGDENFEPEPEELDNRKSFFSRVKDVFT
jgi:molecular chaperone DnaJ